MVSQTFSMSIARAEAYGFIARAFSYPSQQAIHELERALPSISRAASIIDRSGAVSQAIGQMQQALRGYGVQGLQREYSWLFTGRDQCWLNECDYDKAPFSMSNRLADITAYYLAFGLQVAQGTGERPDFIGTEADFLHAILMKRFHAEEQGWGEQAAICAEAEAQFLKEHVLWWMPRLAQGLRVHKGFYGALGAFLLAFLREEQVSCGEVYPL
jgi:TorA maturation chaperone TorD